MLHYDPRDAGDYEYVTSPTGAQVVEHCLAGGRVEVQHLDHAEWVEWEYEVPYISRRWAKLDVPRPGIRLVVNVRRTEPDDW